MHEHISNWWGNQQDITIYNDISKYIFTNYTKTKWPKSWLLCLCMSKACFKGLHNSVCINIIFYTFILISVGHGPKYCNNRTIDYYSLILVGHSPSLLIIGRAMSYTVPTPIIKQCTHSFIYGAKWTWSITLEFSVAAPTSSVCQLSKHSFLDSLSIIGGDRN